MENLFLPIFLLLRKGVSLDMDAYAFMLILILILLLLKKGD